MTSNFSDEHTYCSQRREDCRKDQSQWERLARFAYFLLSVANQVISFLKKLHDNFIIAQRNRANVQQVCRI